MLAMGWADQSSGEVDEGAAQRLEEGRRTASQIRATTQQVYRGKEFAEEGERWDQAHKWSVAEWTEKRHWRRVRRDWGASSSGPSGSTQPGKR